MEKLFMGKSGKRIVDYKLGEGKLAFVIFEKKNWEKLLQFFGAQKRPKEL